ncbi:MAG: oxidoreductase [Spirochaetes bacterium]|nr:MAG: oxidoreductase [Spirochaetota bacterium]
MAENKLGSVLKPFLALKTLGEKPDTIHVPSEYREACDRYRGFHVNDLDKCIGCGTCAEICDNDAIRMVPVVGREAELGKTEYRPVIDYGRCCWCALCVDICTTNSLNMTREYTHIDEETNSFFIFPDENGIHNKKFPKGWQANKDINFLDLERVPMEALGPEQRDSSFVEIVKGFTKQQAQLEASRCVACGLCTAACPAGMNIPEYIDAIWRDDIPEAGRQMYKTNPLPDVCGRICTHNCETACSMGVRGEAISIRWLKRYAMDAIPSEEYKTLINQRVVESEGRSIAIVGAGPAGLSAAYYLVLMGYKVTLFESYPEAGGMMRYGIPEYRLPYDILDKDIDFIISLGVELKTNTRVGTDVTLESLHSSYDSVLIATGLHQGRSTGVPGTDNPMVFQSIDLLAKITKKEEFPVEEKMVVIGGGNVALDIARSLARKQKAKYGKVNLIVTSLESRDIMPADEEEIVEGMEEGIEFHPGRGPEEIVIKNNKIVGLKTSKCTRVFDEEGRFSPEFDKDDIELYEGVMVVESIGQAPDMSYLGPFADSIEYDGRRIKVDEYYQSSENWLFVIGDIIKGPDVITGIATGHTAAQGVDNFLRHIEADGITKIDDILRIAYSYQKDQLAQITQAEETASGKPELEELAGKLDTLKNQELSSLEILDALLVNPDTRIHLRQELPREILKDDFAYITNLESLDMSSGDTISSGVISRLSAAYALYNDLIQLTRSKELKFSLEILRGRNDQSRKVFS